MGNHEFCEGCGENDFHTGRTCQEAYPKSFAREEDLRKKRALEKARGCVLIDELYRELKGRGIDVVHGGDTITIYGFELARAEQKRNARKPAPSGVSDLVYVRGKKLREVCGGAVIRFSTANGPFDLEMEHEDVVSKTAPAADMLPDNPDHYGLDRPRKGVSQ